jgi:hypothetical protein
MDEEGRYKSAQAYQIIGQLISCDEKPSESEIRGALDYFGDEGMMRALNARLIVENTMKNDHTPRSATRPPVEFMKAIGQLSHPVV